MAVLSLSLMLEILLRKLASCLPLGLLFISINLLYDLAWNTAVASGLVLLTTTHICYISYRNGYVGLLVLHLLPLLILWVICEMQLVSVFSRYCFAKCSSEMAKLVQLPHYCGKPLVFFFLIGIHSMQGWTANTRK